MTPFGAPVIVTRKLPYLFGSKAAKKPRERQIIRAGAGPGGFVQKDNLNA